MKKDRETGDNMPLTKEKCAAEIQVIVFSCASKIKGLLENIGESWLK